ncbi:hypothetical protein [Sphingomonas sp.]|jgi:hypothetical protein|uniref:hypothetical protein n=1 Tax=Sphingomonas sp. TaxID=28214 RepID=UPI002DEED281|nr:hypothetical protein [Sphingomonas sp.]
MTAHGAPGSAPKDPLAWKPDAAEVVRFRRRIAALSAEASPLALDLVASEGIDLAALLRDLPLQAGSWHAIGGPGRQPPVWLDPDWYHPDQTSLGMDFAFAAEHLAGRVFRAPSHPRGCLGISVTPLGLRVVALIRRSLLIVEGGEALVIDPVVIPDVVMVGATGAPSGKLIASEFIGERDYPILSIEHSPDLERTLVRFRTGLVPSTLDL